MKIVFTLFEKAIKLIQQVCQLTAAGSGEQLPLIYFSRFQMASLRVAYRQPAFASNPKPVIRPISAHPSSITKLHVMRTSSIRQVIYSLLTVFAFSLLPGLGFSQGTQTFSTPGTTSFTVPPGVTSITVAVWGGGGAGGGVTGGNPRAGGGGEGGSFVRGTIAVTPGTVYTVVVGSGGTASTGNGTSGGSSSFGSSLFLAIGGAGGTAGVSGNNFGTGGNTANTGNLVTGTATSDFYGGNGGSGSNASTATSGGGGGSAGAGGNGGNGGTPTAGTAGAAGSPAAAGVAGAIGRTTGNDGNGNTGGAPGAGGSGGRNANNNTTYTGGAGGAGQVLVTWTCPSATISYSGAPFCQSAASSLPTLTGSAGGSFSSTAGLSINSSTGEINPALSTPGTYTVHYQLAGGNGCPAVDATTSVTIRSTPVSSVVGQSDVNCFAGNDGTITIGVSGGTAPYFYSVDNGVNWTPTASAAPHVFGGLSANIPYRIRVKDSNGCLSK